MNTNANTNTANTTIDLKLDVELKYESDLLTDCEKELVKKGWDDSAYLEGAPGTIAVHNGEFHTDDVLSVVLLSIFAGFNGEVVRTRNPEELKNVDLRIDVGEGLLDHHGKRAETGVAACTRVRQLLDNSGCFAKLQRGTYNNLKQLVAEVAATDCGIGSPNWISQLVQGFNRHGIASGRDHFRLAVKYVTEMVTMLLETWEAECAAEGAALQAIGGANDGKIVVFPAEARIARCKELLHEKAPNAIYYVSPENEEDWRILCAADPAQEFSFFGSRKLIPEKFRGLRGDELSKKSGIPGGIFCHAAGFIAGFKTSEAAIRFAELCLEG